VPKDTTTLRPAPPPVTPTSVLEALVLDLRAHIVDLECRLDRMDEEIITRRLLVVADVEAAEAGGNRVEIRARRDHAQLTVCSEEGWAAVAVRGGQDRDEAALTLSADANGVDPFSNVCFSRGGNAAGWVDADGHRPDTAADDYDNLYGSASSEPEASS
jgi:hypothetical protein